jgi:hypothetical protein
MGDVGSTPGWPYSGYDRPRTLGVVEQALREDYERYLVRQSQAFLSLVPREGIRPLYASARLWAKEQGIHEPRNPMPSLLSFCRARLPLPTFEVWLQDYRTCRMAYAVEAASTPLSDADRAPKQIQTRGLEHNRRRWFAGLHLFKDGPTWRGYISFREARSPTRSAGPTGASTPEFRTADIFCENDPVDIQTRFAEYRAETLRGFLRSTLP